MFADLGTVLPNGSGARFAFTADWDPDHLARLAWSLGVRQVDGGPCCAIRADSAAGDSGLAELGGPSRSIRDRGELRGNGPYRHAAVRTTAAAAAAVVGKHFAG
jgi:hypothetical protein